MRLRKNILSIILVMSCNVVPLCAAQSDIMIADLEVLSTP